MHRCPAVRATLAQVGPQATRPGAPLRLPLAGAARRAGPRGLWTTWTSAGGGGAHRQCMTRGQDELSPGGAVPDVVRQAGTAHAMARRHGSRRRARWHGGKSRSLPARAFAGVEERNEMTIGRTDDPVNPTLAMALEAASLFGIGSRNPSGPAASVPRQQAGHMIAIDLPVRSLIFLLHPRGRPHMRVEHRPTADPP